MIKQKIQRILSIIMIVMLSITCFPQESYKVHAQETSQNTEMEYSYIPSLPDKTNSLRLAEINVIWMLIITSGLMQSLIQQIFRRKPEA